MSLKVEGRCVAMASYCQGSGDDGTPKTLRRRAYWLADSTSMKHVLVHYLDEKVVTEQRSNFTDQQFHEHIQLLIKTFDRVVRGIEPNSVQSDTNSMGLMQTKEKTDVSKCTVSSSE